MTRAGRYMVLAAAALLALAIWPKGADAVAPATQLAAAMPGGKSLIEPVNGARVSSKRTARSWHRRGPACWYPCHWHGPIKHCRSTCR